MQHPETKDLFQDPTFMQKLQTIMQNPQLASAYMQQDPRLQKVFDTAPPPPPQPKAEEKKPEKMEVEDPAEDLKNKGNESFKKKNFDEALNFYE